MRGSIAFCVAALIIGAVSGCVFDSDDGGGEKKGTVSGTVKLTVTGEALPGVRIFLVNTDAPVDTINYDNNYRSLIDSTLTDSNGAYVFKGVAPGHYGILPLARSESDTVSTYRFTFAGDTADSRFTLNGGSHTVNLIATPYSGQGATPVGEYFHIKVTIRHDPGKYFKPIIYSQRAWYGGIPYWLCRGSLFYTSQGQGYKVIIISDINDPVLGPYTADNCYKIDFNDEERTLYICFPNNETPRSSEFEYDYNNDVLTLVNQWM